jgi:hypothetical protein
LSCFVASSVTRFVFLSSSSPPLSSLWAARQWSWIKEELVALKLQCRHLMQSICTNPRSEREKRIFGVQKLQFLLF